MEHLIEGAEEFDLLLTPEQLAQFSRYQSLLLEWNERINLTALRTPREIQTRHFLDSLTCSFVTGDLNQSSLIDVGSGAGFPGLPLKLIYPGLQLVLLESVRKKAAFLELAVSELGLENVLVISERAEVLGHNPAHRARYDWAAARAVAHLSPLLEYLLPFCRINGHALAQKGKRAAEEVAESQNALEILGGELVELMPISIADESDAYLVVVKKMWDTPKEYPRRAGVPAKRPL